MIIFGTRHKGEIAGYAPGMCTSCGPTVLGVIQRKKKFTLYFVPVFTYSTDSTVLCVQCGLGSALPPGAQLHPTTQAAVAALEGWLAARVGETEVMTASQVAAELGLDPAEMRAFTRLSNAERERLLLEANDAARRSLAISPSRDFNGERNAFLRLSLNGTFDAVAAATERAMWSEIA